MSQDGIFINPRSGVPIFRQLVDQVRTLIVSGQLGPGEQLMAVRAFAEHLGVTPTTVSKAYGILEMEGLIERRRGLGMFVREDDPNAIAISRRKIVTELVTQAAVAARLIHLSVEEWQAIVTGVWRKVVGETEKKK